MSEEHCRLCGATSEFWTKDKNRSYYKCNTCDYVQVATEELPSSEEEKSRYNLHENSSNNLGYVQFLNRLIVPLEQFIDADSKGLDYGCGPEPVLANHLIGKGYEMESYDPFFKPEKDVLNAEYDFITTTEVVEHMHNPKVDLKTLVKSLKKGGMLGIMTAFYNNDDSMFLSWYYKNDFTHVGFFNKQTLLQIAKQFNLELMYCDDPVAIFKNK